MLIFLRHPRPDVEPGICYGRLDLDIHQDGHAQIEAAVEKTPKVTRIVASPALRCRKLTLELASQNEVEPVFDERLWEMHMGDWEGLPWKEIPRELSETWLKDPFNLPCPGGESFAQVQTRVLDAVSGLGPETAIVCHAGPIRALQMAWQGLTFREAFASTPAFAEPMVLSRPD